MSELHLSTGSTKPPKVEGKLRLYSMKYCQYAHRTLLVLKHKNIPHDVVNVNLTKKPDWIFQIHPEGKVPALDTGDSIVVESLDICNYLDEKFPNPPLYPADAALKQKQLDLLDKLSPLLNVFGSILYKKDERSAEEWAKELRPHLDIFEEALSNSSGPFFGGNNLGIVDIMLWPNAERSGALALVLGEKLPFANEEFPKLRAWKKSMQALPIVEELYTGPESFKKVVECKLNGEDPGYDNM